MDLIMHKFLTIVIPIYNVELYLRQCLDSLVNQTCKDFESILVNDGSTDNSATIAKEYALEYPGLFRYVEQENKGLGAARNKGFTCVKTEMVGFLDSDDWLPIEYVEIIKSHLSDIKPRPDIIYTLPVVFDCSTSKFYDWFDKAIFDRVFSSRSEIDKSNFDYLIYSLEPNANRKIYKTEFLRKYNLIYPEGIKWEDVEPHFEQLHHCESCLGISETGFFYRFNSGQQITTSINYDRLDIVSIFKRLIEKSLAENWKQIEKLYIIRMLYKFTRWTIPYCTNEIRTQLITKLHPLYGSIAKKTWKDFYVTMNLPKEDILFIKLLCSRSYKVLTNPIKYRKIETMFLRKR